MTSHYSLRTVLSVVSISVLLSLTSCVSTYHAGLPGYCVGGLWYGEPNWDGRIYQFLGLDLKRSQQLSRHSLIVDADGLVRIFADKEIPPDTRFAAAFVLGEVKCEQAVPVFERVLRDETEYDFFVLKGAQQGLYKMAPHVLDTIPAPWGNLKK